MKIVVKENEKYVSDLHSNKVIYGYLIYAMLDDNTPMGCEEIIGDKERDNVIKYYFSVMQSTGDLTVDENTTYETLVDKYVQTVKYDDFKDAIINDKPTYNG